MAALTAATVFITTGCQNDTESKIVGKYEHPAQPLNFMPTTHL